MGNLNPGRVRRLLGNLRWWPWLLGPAAAVAVILASRLTPRPVHLKPPLEAVAPYLVAAAAAVYAIRAIVTRNPLHLILVALACALLWRELHIAGSGAHSGIYAALAAIGVWAALWRRRIAGPLRDFRHTSWLIATMWTYFLALLVSRRAFRFIPGEQAAHINLEESLETAAHLMLMATSLLGNWKRHGRRAASPKGDERHVAAGPAEN